MASSLADSPAIDGRSNYSKASKLSKKSDDLDQKELNEAKKRLARIKNELYKRFAQRYVPVLMFMDKDPT